MSLTQSGGRAAERYAALRGAREVYLIRARDASTLTLPYLYPPLGFNPAMQLPTPYQSMGARGVRNLASKLLLSLFPTNTTFFKYEIDDFLLDEIAQKAKEAGANVKVTLGDFQKAMSRRERAIMIEINKSLLRVAAFPGLLHLIVSGNYLLYTPDKGRVRGFGLSQYVVRRSPDDELLELVVEEAINTSTLPAEHRLALLKHSIAQMASGKGVDTDGDHDHSGTGDKTSKLYTHVYRCHDKWEVYQECEGVVLPGTEGTYPLDECPWMPLRWSTHPCEDYGRSYVEEFLGDLDSLESLSQTLVEGIAATARVVFLVKPNGVTRVEVVAKARNGDVRSGNAEDVTVVQAANKTADFQTAQRQAQEIATRLSYAFMLNSTVQRDAERVTAEEIKYVAGELDDALGGVYTLLAAEWQLPIVTIFERRMQKARRVPPLPKGVAEPSITTGLEAIGRGNDLQAMRAFTQDVVTALTPQVAMQYLDGYEYIQRAASSYGIAPDGLVRSKEEVMAEQQQAQQQEMMNNLAPHVIKAGGGMAQAAIANSGQNSPQQ